MNTVQLNHISLPTVASTNTWLKENADNLPHATVVSTPCQSAGRGQRGNSWESTPGKNLTFSLLLRPLRIIPAEQFVISEVVANACADFVRMRLAPTIAPERVAVKWPNDIYVDDRKIAGILIEHSISSSGIGHTIVGVGLNVNQREFVSDAPNPVSMWQLIGADTPLDSALNQLCQMIMERFAHCDSAEKESAKEQTHTELLQNLWRRQGFHPFVTPPGELFMAEIADVLVDGRLVLTDSEGRSRQFAFKEVSFII